jgi:hypothetical protein
MPKSRSQRDRSDCDHQPVPISRDLREPQDHKPTKWRCRLCGLPVDPITREAA